MRAHHHCGFAVLILVVLTVTAHAQEKEYVPSARYNFAAMNRLAQACDDSFKQARENLAEAQRIASTDPERSEQLMAEARKQSSLGNAMHQQMVQDAALVAANYSTLKDFKDPGYEAERERGIAFVQRMGESQKLLKLISEDFAAEARKLYPTQKSATESISANQDLISKIRNEVDGLSYQLALGLIGTKEQAYFQIEMQLKNLPEPLRTELTENWQWALLADAPEPANDGGVGHVFNLGSGESPGDLGSSGVDTFSDAMASGVVTPWAPGHPQDGATVFGPGTLGSRLDVQGVQPSSASGSSGSTGGGGSGFGSGILGGTGGFFPNPNLGGAICLDTSSGTKPAAGYSNFQSPAGFANPFTFGPITILGVTVQDMTPLRPGYVAGDPTPFSFTGTPSLQAISTGGIRVTGVQLVGPTVNPAPAAVTFKQP